MQLDGLEEAAAHRSTRREFAFIANTRPSTHAQKLRLNSREGTVSPRTAATAIFSPTAGRRPGKVEDNKQFLHQKQKKDASRIARIVAAIPDKAAGDADTRAGEDLMCRTMTLSADWKAATPVAFQT